MRELQHQQILTFGNVLLKPKLQENEKVSQESLTKMFWTVLQKFFINNSSLIENLEILRNSLYLHLTTRLQSRRKTIKKSYKLLHWISREKWVSHGSVFTKYRIVEIFDQSASGLLMLLASSLRRMKTESD